MAGLSKLEIANMALGHIGEAKTIESFDQPNSSEARQIRLWYEPSRVQTLAAFDWSFARKRQLLSLLEEDPTIEWGYRYQYPTDCLAMRRIVNPLGYVPDGIPYTFGIVEGSEAKTVLTNMGEATAEYTHDFTTETLFPMQFAYSLSLGLAMNIAYPLTLKRTLTGDLKNEFRFSFLEAAAVDANEAQEQPHRNASWIRVR